MTEAISPELRAILRRLKLGPILATLPERLLLARQQQLSIASFLETVLADEVARRDHLSGDRRAKAASLDPEMRLERWDGSTDVRFDRPLWGDLCTLRFLEDAHNVLITKSPSPSAPTREQRRYEVRSTSRPSRSERPLRPPKPLRTRRDVVVLENEPLRSLRTSARDRS